MRSAEEDALWRSRSRSTISGAESCMWLEKCVCMRPVLWISFFLFF